MLVEYTEKSNDERVGGRIKGDYIYGLQENRRTNVNAKDKLVYHRVSMV